MKALVVGAGSLGSLIGGLLARQHEVVLVGREAHVAAIERDGLSLEGVFDERVEPRATTDPVADGLDAADLALVTTKADDTPDAATLLKDCRVDAVCSLQNGLGNEATLAAALDVPVLAGAATYGADRERAGAVTCTGIGEIVLGPRIDAPSPAEDLERAEEVAEAVGTAGVDAAADPEMPTRCWEKLAINAGINPVTALADVDNGALAEGLLGNVARAAARETATVAREEGIALDPGAAASALQDVVTDTAANRSSMRQDVAAGRRTEIDAINGAVLERAREHGIDVPVNRRLTALVRGWERGNGLRA